MTVPVSECDRCRERAFAFCTLCAARPAFCIDHWLAHIDAIHGIKNERIEEAAEKLDES